MDYDSYYVVGYRFLDNTYCQLPPFVPGTEDTVLVPRPETALAAARAPVHDSVYNCDMQGEWSSAHQLRPGDFHTIPQVGYGYAVWPEDILVPGQQNPGAIFQLGTAAEPLTHRTIVPALYQIWAKRGYEVTIHELFRLKPVMVLGEITPNALPAAMLVQLHSVIHINPPGWPHERLLLVSEQLREGESEPHGIRLLPVTYAVREFLRWETADGKVLEEFKVSPT